MKPTRLTQPYRQGARHPGAALTAMKRGRTAGGFNPQDITRNAQKLMAAGKRKRPERPPRLPRPPR